MCYEQEPDITRLAVCLAQRKVTHYYPHTVFFMASCVVRHPCVTVRRVGMRTNVRMSGQSCQCLNSSQTSPDWLYCPAHKKVTH